MEIPESVLCRMPSDLLAIVQKGNRMADVPLYERDPADDAETEVVSAGSFNMKVYFPPIRWENTVVVVHFPGGKSEKLLHRNRINFGRYLQE